MPTLAPGSTVSFPLQVDQVLTLTNNFSTGNVVLSAQKSGDVVYSYTNEQMQDSPVFSPGSQGIVTINNATGFLTYNVTSSAFPLFENTPRTIFQSAIPFILAGGTATNQFTINATGLVTALPTLPFSTGNVWIYMPAITGLGGGTAGWFYAAVQSTTSVQLYTARYTSGDPKLFVPTTLVQPSGVTAGNYSQSAVGTATATYQITVPGGSMGPNGSLRTTHMGLYRSVTSQSVLATTFGGSGNLYMQQGQAANDPNNGQIAFICSIMNINSVSRQYAPAFQGDTVNNTNNSAAFFSVNTANDVTMTATIQLGNAGSYSILQGARIEVFYGS
jgi:hypothetical protein